MRAFRCPSQTPLPPAQPVHPGRGRQATPPAGAEPSGAAATRAAHAGRPARAGALAEFCYWPPALRRRQRQWWPQTRWRRPCPLTRPRSDHDPDLWPPLSRQPPPPPPPGVAPFADQRALRTTAYNLMVVWHKTLLHASPCTRFRPQAKGPHVGGTCHDPALTAASDVKRRRQAGGGCQPVTSGKAATSHCGSPRQRR